MMIILTGHKGFIGSHLYKFLNNKLNTDVLGIDLKDGNDLCDANLTSSLPDCDICIHFAATNGTKLFYSSPTNVTRTNTLHTFNLIERYKNSKTKFIFASTCEIFNGATDKGLHSIPTDETVPIVFEDIINPRWSYSLPKALGENLVANGMNNWLVIRFFNIYGPGQIDHFISEFEERILNENNYSINGNDTRSFCYIDDAVNILDRIIFNLDNEIINIGNPIEYQIADVAKMIMEIHGLKNYELKINASPKGSATRRSPDVSKLRKFIGDFAYTPLIDGLKQTLKI